jgi:lipopolysaccharide transport system permease protein
MRDFSMLISIGMLFLMFTSGIFWDVREIADPRMTELILLFNPIAFILDAYRQVLLKGYPPDYVHLVMVGCGAVMLIVLSLRALRRHSKFLALKALTA